MHLGPTRTYAGIPAAPRFGHRNLREEHFELHIQTIHE